jgi:hypothetical protein
VGNFYRRVTLIDTDGDRVILFNDGRGGRCRRRRKKVSRGLRPLERMNYRAVKGLDAFGDTLIRRYRRSRGKRRDRWLTDGPRNFMKAQRKAMRRMRF